MKKALIVLIGIVVIVISSFLLYKYYPILEAYYYNREISVSGIKLHMTEDELNNTLKNGEFVPGMGGNGWRFSKEKVFVMTSSIGLFKDKVSLIDTENPSHSILEIKTGDNYDSALSVLTNRGFKELSDNIFIKGNVLIQLRGESKISGVRITIQDPATKDLVF
ncbi:MAG TPA: hypothetical protein GX505_02245 [Clostridiales bacterium]|nr:hypothetical protein [Clostridiales bacterium]